MRGSWTEVQKGVRLLTKVKYQEAAQVGRGGGAMGKRNVQTWQQVLGTSLQLPSSWQQPAHCLIMETLPHLTHTLNLSGHTSCSVCVCGGD